MKSKRLVRTVCVWTIWTVGIVAGLYGVAYLITIGMVAKEVRSARASNIPVELDQLPIKQVPPEQNGANDYKKAFELLAQIDQDHRRLPSAAITINDKILPAGVDSEMASISQYQNVLDSAEVAASKPACVFPVDWSKGITLRFPELQLLKFLARLEAGEAELFLAKDQIADALRHLAFAEKICGDMTTTPNFTSETSFAAAQGLVFHSIISMLSSDRANAKFLTGIQALLDGLPPPPPIRFYAAGELVLNRLIIHRMPDMNSEELDELLAGSQEGVERDQLERILRMRSFNPLYDESFIAYYRGFIDSLPKDDTHWSELQKSAEAADRRSSDRSLASTGTLLFSKSLVSTCADYIKHLARTRMLQCAVRLLEWQRSGKSLPDQLPNYGTVSIDPFSGRPFLYDHAGTHFEIYSVGQEGEGARIKGVNDLRVAIPSPELIPPSGRLQAPGVQVRTRAKVVFSKLHIKGMGAGPVGG